MIRLSTMEMSSLPSSRILHKPPLSVPKSVMKAYPAVESTAMAEGFSIFPPQSVKQRSKFKLHTKTFE
uniref:Uncharacterized protein n=1 Tax=Parascaris univalens TaxID=6257 RepID=A0A915AC09_PARUN